MKRKIAHGDEFEAGLSPRQEAIVSAIEAARRELREMPEAAPLRPEDRAAEGDVVFVGHVVEAINDLLVCAANVLERDLSAQEQKPFRDHVRAMRLRRFGLSPDSERHARVALLGLVHEVVEKLRAESQEHPPVSATTTISTNIDRVPATELAEVFGAAATRVRDAYREDFAAEAEKLTTAQKHAELVAVLYHWWLSAEGITSQTAQWQALETLGRGIFQKTDAEDWRKNIWHPLRTLVCGPDDRTV